MDKFSRILKLLRLVLPLAMVGLVAGGAQGQVHSIDTVNSKVVVHAFKSGLFSGFADNHEVEAPIAEGSIDESASRVRFVIDSRRLRVLDPQLSPDKRRQVQERMIGPDVLDSDRYPQIEFESTKVEQTAAGSLLVTGKLSLHGAVRPISLTVSSENGRYRGTCSLKQRDFGITPVSIAGGTVKVKNELKIDFEIRTNAQPNTAAGN
jgi:polyisoprenoid-binding protein YceI